MRPENAYVEKLLAAAVNVKYCVLFVSMNYKIGDKTSEQLTLTSQKLLHVSKTVTDNFVFV